MGKHVCEKRCNGCRHMRRRSQFPSWRWKLEQFHCLLDECRKLNDPRRKRMKALNKTSNKTRWRQALKGEARNIGEYNSNANKVSARQSEKGKRRHLGDYISVANKIANQVFARQGAKGKRRNLGPYNSVANSVANKVSACQSKGKEAQARRVQHTRKPNQHATVRKGQETQPGEVQRANEPCAESKFCTPVQEGEET